MMKKANRKKTIITMLVAVAVIGLMAGLFAMQHNDNVAGDSKAKATPAQSEPLTGDSPADSGTAASGKTEGDGGEGKSGGSADPYARAEQMLKDYPDEKYEGFILQLKGDVSAEDVEAVDRAIAGGAHLTKLQYTEGAYTAASLEDIRACVDGSLIDCIQPDFQKHMMEGETEQQETDVALQSAVEPNDPKYSSQYNLPNMKVPTVWSYGLDGRDQDNTVDMDYDGNGTGDAIIVAVIDSGLVSEHEDMDESRVVDGYNFAADRNTWDTQDDNGHGSFVSGVIAAKSDNRKGIAGILQGVEIMPIRVFDRSGRAVSSVFLEAVNYACDQKEEYIRTGGRDGVNISVINMSLGGPVPDPLERQACNRAMNDGMILVCAAGNEYSKKGQLASYPAQYTMGVGAVDDDNTVSYYSQRLSASDGSGYANKLWVTAPGDELWSVGASSERSYQHGSGTSFSCPELSALAALCKSLDNDMNQAEFMKLLKDTAVRKSGTQGKINGQDVQYGWGLTDYGRTINRLLGEKAADLSGKAITRLNANRNGSSVLDKTVMLASMRAYAEQDAYQVALSETDKPTVTVYGITLHTLAEQFGRGQDCPAKVTIKGKRLVDPAEGDAAEDGGKEIAAAESGETADDADAAEKAAAGDEPGAEEDAATAEKTAEGELAVAEADASGTDDEEVPQFEECTVTLTADKLNRSMLVLYEDPLEEDDSIISQGNYMRLAVDGSSAADWLYDPELVTMEVVDHHWDGGKVTRAATSTRTGVKTFTCTVCGATKRETIPMLAPGAASGVQVTGYYSSRQINVMFNPGAGATNYLVRWRQNGGSWQSKAVGGSTSAWIGGLSTGAMIDVQVQSYRSTDGKYGPWSDTGRCLMSTVKTKKAKGGKKKVTVRWKKTSGATGYKVYYSTRKDMKGAKVKTVGKKKTSCTIKGLKKKTRYYVAVCPVRTSGNTYDGILSSIRSAKTKK
ncbi:MAG: S8 family serine peptidase [Firmicutes bacterium]|nr:S8 family serine peptidase [Bacillota bacterium]